MSHPGATATDRHRVVIIGSGFGGLTASKALKRADVEIKVYSNQASVGLSLNGVDLGSKSVDDHVAVWQVRLTPGRNRIEAVSGAVRAKVEWIHQP